MTCDKGRHREIRKSILEGLPEGCECYTSHNGEGDISFFRVSNEHRTNMAEPDIVLEGSGRILVIEVELSDSPKRLIGVAGAIHSSNMGDFVGKPIDIEKKSLLLVVDSNKVCKKGSKKLEQAKEVKALINDYFDFEWFNIAIESKALDSIQEWIDRDEEEDRSASST